MAKRPTRRPSYKRSVYRRRKIKYILIASLSALAALFVIFVIVGNALDRKVDTVVSSLDGLEEEKNSATSDTGAAHATPVKVISKSTALSAEGSSLDSRLAKLSKEGASAVCFELDSKDGKVLYSSKVAQELGYQESGSSLWKLDNAIQVFDKHELYSIGITYVSELDSSNDLTRSAAIGYYAARIAEAFRAGVDEVLIYAPDTAPERMDELIRLSDEVHRLVPEAVLGITLPYPLPEYPAELESSSDTVEVSESQAETDTVKEFSDSLINDLWSAFDFFALDVCYSAEGDEIVSEAAESRLGELLYYVLRYDIRILIPSGDEITDELAGICEQRGLTNIQFMP